MQSLRRFYDESLVETLFQGWNIHARPSSSPLTLGCDVSGWFGRFAVSAVRLPGLWHSYENLVQRCRTTTIAQDTWSLRVVNHLETSRTCTNHANKFVILNVIPHEALYGWRFGDSGCALGAARDNQSWIFFLINKEYSQFSLEIYNRRRG